MLLGLPATLSADEQLHKAIAVVKQGVSHPQIEVLLGEVDLCRIAESRRMAMPTARLTDAPCDYEDWQRVWGTVESQGRQRCPIREPFSCTRRKLTKQQLYLLGVDSASTSDTLYSINIGTLKTLLQATKTH